MKKNTWLKRRLDERGFNFIELLIALLIFSIGIMGVLSLQGISLMSTDFSGNMGAARLLASDQLERLGGLSFTATALTVCSPTPFCYADTGGGAAGTGRNIGYTGQFEVSGRFRREWDVAAISTTVKQVTVRVRWTDVPGVTQATAQTFNRSLQMTTIKINPN